MSTCPLQGLAWRDIEIAFDFHSHYDSGFAATVGRSLHMADDLVVRGAANGGRGWPLVACETGLVHRMPSALGGPFQLAIETPDWIFVYTHMDSATPAQWPDLVQEGDPIGTLGGQGLAAIDRPHLHFMQFSRSSRHFVDPAPYLARSCGGSPPLVTRIPGLEAAADFAREHPLIVGAVAIAALSLRGDL